MEIIIVGYGKIGHAIAQQLADESHDLVIVDENPDVKMNSIRKLFFNNIICSGPQFLWIKGKEGNHVRDIEFNDCSFTLTNGDEFIDKTCHGSARHGFNDVDHHPMNIMHADNVRFNNTSFNVR